MKTLINRNLTESQRDDILGMAENEDGETTFNSLRTAFIEKLNELGYRNDTKAYNASDLRGQSNSDWSRNFNKYGK